MLSRVLQVTNYWEVLRVGSSYPVLPSVVLKALQRRKVAMYFLHKRPRGRLSVP